MTSQALPCKSSITSQSNTIYWGPGIHTLEPGGSWFIYRSNQDPPACMEMGEASFLGKTQLSQHQFCPIYVLHRGHIANILEIKCLCRYNHTRQMRESSRVTEKMEYSLRFLCGPRSKESQEEGLLILPAAAQKSCNMTSICAS